MINGHKISFIILIFFDCSNQREIKIDLIDHVSRQLNYAVEITGPLRDSILISPRTIENGELKLVRSGNWTSGFFAGNLWVLYELAGEAKRKELVPEYTLPLEKEQWNGGSHDANVLFELRNFSEGKAVYKEVANKLLTTLSSPGFLAAVGENEGFLLKHPIGSKPNNSEVGAPLLYAGYYFLKSNIKKSKYGET